jgi:hypothetical protein
MLNAFNNQSPLVKVREFRRINADLLIKAPIYWGPLIDFVPIEEGTTLKQRSIVVVT